MTSFNKLLTVSFLAVLLLAVALPFSVIFASESDVFSFDETSIYDDLRDSTILDKPFNIEDYPLNPNGTPELLAFTEFAFTLKYEYQKYYGLYVYLYYPQGNLVIDEDVHDIKMACKYKDNEPVHWCHYPLKFLSKDINGVLYKFKIMDSITEPENKIVDTFSRVAMSSTNRRYDINSIQLMEIDKKKVDYSIGGTWTITGYDKGMHDTSMEESTLQSVATFKNTLKLDVHSTYFRSWLVEDSFSMADLLSSVYFSVPNSIDKSYDRLYAIDFEAYKYLTSPMFVIYGSMADAPGLQTGWIDHKQVYKNLYNQRGLSMSEIEELNEYSWMAWHANASNTFNTQYYYYYGNSNPNIVDDAYSYELFDKLAWVLSFNDVVENEISSEKLLAYMAEFSSTRNKDILHRYNSLLFSDHYYSNYNNVENVIVENGYIRKSIIADKMQELKGTPYQHSFWEQLALAFKSTKEPPVPLEFLPIQCVEWNDIKNMSDEDISLTYFVAKADVAEFKLYVQQQEAFDKSVYLFRFDVSPTYNALLNCENKGYCGFVTQQPVFLDFDIISLTYDKAGVKTVLPVVSNPIDIIAGIEPPGNIDLGLSLNDFNDFLVAIYSMLIVFFLAIVFIMLVLPILKSIFRIRKK